MDVANEIAWRVDTRRFSEKERLDNLFMKIFKNELSRGWRGYNQGHHCAMKILMARAIQDIPIFENPALVDSRLTEF
ncbi:hypothetical protein [Nitrosospira sp. NpAV]|uniref:hypothetical protein n=1 Tax=Nitrosospira sp. NpAV TaxID=58133 RepID=UPI0005A24293|nr:hypothetical protein [Nitrosospira sp. NpAV]KIO48222.1 hypothetical protein SQ11_13825 [Nitrosospira sp. NpAV]